jgi:hypothetical protein
MYLDRGHLRFDGVYVARNTYVRMGAVEWRVKHAVHLVAYYRYLRFLPDGERVEGEEQGYYVGVVGVLMGWESWAGLVVASCLASCHLACAACWAGLRAVEAGCRQVLAKLMPGGPGRAVPAPRGVR